MIRRAQAVEIILHSLANQDVLLTSTGMISRQAFATRDRPGTFYMLGSMGLLSSLGLGLAIMCPQRRVVVLEGDGSALMSLGTLPLIAVEGPANLTHVVLDNEAYESTGAQPSISRSVSLARLASASGYRSVTQVDDGPDLQSVLAACSAERGPNFVLVKADLDSSGEPPRVPLLPMAMRDRLKAHITGCPEA